MLCRSRSLLFAVAFSSALLPSTSWAQSFREYSLPAGSGPTSITIAADGTPWFTETTANKIGHISGLGTISHKTIPTAGSAPWGIASQGNYVFFTEANTGFIGFVSAGTAVMEAGTGTPLTTPHEIVSTGDSSFWVADYGANQIQFIYGLSCFIGCSFASSAATAPTPSSGPEALSIGPDGAMWLTEMITGNIGIAAHSYSVSTNTHSVSLAEHSGGSVTSQPQGIALGPEGTVWFTEKGVNKIGRMNAAGTLIAEYTIPTANSQPHSIAVGPRGDLYFTEEAGNKIGRIRVDGTITEFPIPTPNSGPTGIAVDRFGTVWFTEKAASKIGAMSSVAGDENADGYLNVLDLIYLINYLFAGGAAPL